MDREGRDVLIYKDLLADTKDGGASLVNDRDDTAGTEESRSEDSDADSEEYSDDDESGRPRGKRFLDKDEKKAHKHAVKEEKREKRKTKMPKAMKKKLVSQGGRKKH